MGKLSDKFMVIAEKKGVEVSTIRKSFPSDEAFEEALEEFLETVGISRKSFIFPNAPA